MSWSRRGILLSAAAVAGCGFSPALAPGGAAAGIRGDVEIGAPGSTAGFHLTRQLEERLGLPRLPDYRLQLAITQGAQVTGIPSDRVTARSNIIGEVDYVLVHIPSGEVVRRGSVQSFTGLSTTSTVAATRTAWDDAEIRLMTLLADRIAMELLATTEEWRR